MTSQGGVARSVYLRPLDPKCSLRLMLAAVATLSSAAILAQCISCAVLVSQRSCALFYLRVKPYRTRTPLFYLLRLSVSPCCRRIQTTPRWCRLETAKSLGFSRCGWLAAWLLCAASHGKLLGIRVVDRWWMLYGNVERTNRVRQIGSEEGSMHAGSERGSMHAGSERGH